MHTHTTSCPHCGTRFRVTDIQLSQARGRVRCGNCLEAFQAASGLGTINAPLLIDKPSAVNADANAPTDSDSTTGTLPTSDVPAQTDQEHTPHSPLQNNDSCRQIPDAAACVADENDDSAEDNPEALFTLPDARDAATDAELIDTHDLYIDAAVSEPDDVPTAMTQPRRHGLLWGGLCIVLLLLLAAQYLTYNVTSLATNSMLRPLYTQVCQRLDCQLPSASDLDQLSASNLMIRSIKQQPGELLVDLLLYNGAAQPQPFPRLKLMFSGLQNQPIAAGILTPDDYLGRLKGMQRMPSHQQVHISFRINDPGKTAINYSLQLLLPDHA